MSDYNHVGMSGRLTRDVELKYLPKGTPVAETGFACSRKYNDKEETTFIDLRVYGKQGEVFAKYLSKGRRVIISGRLDLDQWATQDGQKRSKHRITVENFTFVDDGQKQGEAEGKFYPPAEKQQAAPAVDDEEIPF